MALKIRRGTDAQRSGVIFDQGEIVWTTDAQKLWVGDGITQGGVPVVGSSVIGYGLSFNNTTKRIELGTVFTDDITESPTAVKKFFTQELAQDAAALLFTTGIHSGISIQYDDQNGRINLTVDTDDIGITDVVNDTTPQLGGDLDLNGFDITGTGNIDVDSVTAGTLTNGSITFNNDIATFANNTFTLGDNTNPLNITFKSNEDGAPLLVFKGITSGTTSSGGSFEFRSAGGSLSVPTAVNPADAISLISSWGYTGAGYIQSSIIGTFVDPSSTVASSSVPGMIGLINFVDTNPANYRALFLNRKGYVTLGREVTYDAKAHMDINGLMFLEPQTAEPVNKYAGMICVADNATWDPASVAGESPYPVFWNGSTWLKMFS